MEITRFSTMSGRMYQSTRRHIPEGSYIRIHSRENVGFQRLYYCISVPAGNREKLASRKFKVTHGHGYCVEQCFVTLLASRLTAVRYEKIIFRITTFKSYSMRRPPRSGVLEFPYSAQVKQGHKFRSLGLQEVLKT